MTPPDSIENPQAKWTKPITECIHCQYSLEGLAETGQCPECGNAYDKVGFAFSGPDRTRMIRIRRIGISIFLLLCLWSMWTTVPWSGTKAFNLVACSVTVVIWLTRAFVFRPSRVAINREALVVCTENDKDRSYPTREIDHLEITPSFGRIDIYFLNQANVSLGSHTILGSRESARAFVENVNSWLAEHR